MASVTLTSIWLQNVADLTTALQLHSTSLVETNSQDGTVRPYANGRQRTVTTASKPRSVALSFTLVSAADAATLKSWAGQLVLVRDPFGLRMWGSFFTLARNQQVAPNVNDLSVTFTEVTHSDAV